MSPQRDGRDVQQIWVAAACRLWRRFGALARLAAHAGLWFALLPTAATYCPNTPDGSPCGACPVCLPKPPERSSR